MDDDVRNRFSGVKEVHSTPSVRQELHKQQFQARKTGFPSANNSAGYCSKNMRKRQLESS
jgi:hypothetical protein